VCLAAAKREGQESRFRRLKRRSHGSRPGPLPHTDFEGGSRGVRVVQRLDEGLSHVRRRSVPQSQRVALANFNGSLLTRLIRRTPARMIV